MSSCYRERSRISCTLITRYHHYELFRAKDSAQRLGDWESLLSEIKASSQLPSVQNLFIKLMDGVCPLFFLLPCSILWNASHFYHYLWLALKRVEMKAKPVDSSLINNLNKNFEGEGLWNIQNWANQLEISEKPENINYNVPHCRQSLGSCVLYLVYFLLLWNTLFRELVNS